MCDVWVVLVVEFCEELAGVVWFFAVFLCVCDVECVFCACDCDVCESAFFFKLVGFFVVFDGFFEVFFVVVFCEVFEFW